MIGILLYATSDLWYGNLMCAYSTLQVILNKFIWKTIGKYVTYQTSAPNSKIIARSVSNLL